MEVIPPKGAKLTKVSEVVETFADQDCLEVKQVGETPFIKLTWKGRKKIGTFLAIEYYAEWKKNNDEQPIFQYISQKLAPPKEWSS